MPTAQWRLLKRIRLFLNVLVGSLLALHSGELRALSLEFSATMLHLYHLLHVPWLQRLRPAPRRATISVVAGLPIYVPIVFALFDLGRVMRQVIFVLFIRLLLNACIVLHVERLVQPFVA